jgi:hypothetical protein
MATAILDPVNEDLKRGRVQPVTVDIVKRRLEKLREYQMSKRGALEERT